MRYSVDPWVFEKNPDIVFGIIVAHNVKNFETDEIISRELESAELQCSSSLSNIDIKEYPPIKVYRQALQNVGINPNKFTNSVEAMFKRIAKGNKLPHINALVDIGNIISIEEAISLGGHDLGEIKEDLAVRKSRKGDKYLPFGETSFEELNEGELVFVSGNIVQTRQWLWRQSELGKTKIESTDLFFQIVGFKGDHYFRFLNGMSKIEKALVETFAANTERFIVDKENPQMRFN